MPGRERKSSRTDDDDHRLYDCRMSLIGGLITGVTGMLLGAGVGVSVALSIQVILLAVFTALGITGTKLLSRVKRFQIYIEELQAENMEM